MIGITSPFAVEMPSLDFLYIIGVSECKGDAIIFVLQPLSINTRLLLTLDLDAAEHFSKAVMSWDISEGPDVGGVTVVVALCALCILFL